VPVEPSRDIELALRRAIQEDRLVLHYQPKVDLRSGRVVAAEAFLRWRHPSGGLMLPGSFLPIAEDNAMMPALAEWVLLEACAENQRWRDAGAPPVRVSVNVAPSQLRTRRMPELVDRVLRFTRLPAELLELELSSQSLELDVRILREDVATLRGMGVRCVVDDIGRAGRIEDLARLDVDAIELGRRHVHQIDTDGGRVAAGVLALADALGIETVAEGIESTDQLEFVRERGCTAAQGFLLARPAVGEEVEHLLGLRFDDIGHEDDPIAINPVA
jgi:EAL domain-containing protein (putative c-di-GMP-specific phosphodiesterase class I)